MDCPIQANELHSSGPEPWHVCASSVTGPVEVDRIEDNEVDAIGVSVKTLCWGFGVSAHIN